MKTIGIIGGITPQSTILYYQILNDLATSKYGDKHSCKIIINSVDFAEISQLQSEGDWNQLDEIMAELGKSLENAGADVILIAANTMHLCIDAVREVVQIPVIHIAEATARAIQSNGLNKVGLLGTNYTMEKPFYKDILTQHAIDSFIPNSKDREVVHNVIYSELAKGELNPSSKEAYLKIINKMIQDGAEGIILGCTEIPLLIKQEDVSVPVFDTTLLHANAGFEFVSN